MKLRNKQLISTFSYALTSNIISTVISTLIIMIIPKLIGVSEYGYWQLYIFYTSYLGFFNIGWVEGIYLRYGGEEYTRLNKNLFSAQFWTFFLYVFFASSIIVISSLVYLNDSNKQFILQMVAVCLMMFVPRGFLLFILQSTNRIKEFSKITIIDRVIYCLVVVLMLIGGVRDYKMLIIADLFSKLISLIMTMYVCKEIVFNKMISLKLNFQEIVLNISVGIKLMIANIASMLIVGVVRFGIERSWDMKTFGKVSLTFSISNLMMLFINAIGIIMFPILRRTDEKKLSGIYLTIRDFLMLILLGLIGLYYPIKGILSLWLPAYNDSLMYMALVFPMCVFEGKMSLLINTYLKTLRKEKSMLKINLISVSLSFTFTLVSTVIFKNLNLAIISIVILLALRCVLSELYLSRILSISLIRDIILELVMTLVFILTGWFVSSWISAVIYTIAYILYLIIKRKDLTNTIKSIRILAIN